MKNTTDKYSYVSEAMKLYKTLIKIWGLHTPQSKFIKPFFIAMNAPILQRMLISHHSAQISRANELILDLEDEVQKEEYENLILEYMSDIESFKKIRPKTSMTPKMLMQHIKNALAHAEYDIDTSEDEEHKIIIHSNFIEGEITPGDLELLSEFYMGIVSKLNLTDEMHYCMQDFLQLKTNNNELLKKTISKILVGKNMVGMKLPREIKIFADFDLTGTARPLSDEKQELIYDYIKYVAGQKWFQLSDTQKGGIFSRVITPMLSQEYVFQHSTLYLTKTLEWILKMPVDKNVMSTLEYSAPTIYSGLILELGFLNLNYVKEAQRKQYLPGFNYFDVDLSKIKYWPPECVETVSKEEEQRQLSLQAEAYDSTTAKLLKNINNSQNVIQSVNQANISVERKQEIIQEQQKRITESKEKLTQIQQELEKIQEEKTNATGYTNSNDFFKHLRNSISHGFYKIDYSKALKEKDMSLIVYHFQDWNIDKDDRKKRTLVFEAEITAGQLLNIFQTIESRLDKAYTPEQTDEVIVVKDIRTDKTLDKELQTDFQTYMDEKTQRHARK